MIELEKENFRVDSTGWNQLKNKQGVIYLESPLEINGISEFVDGVDEKLIGQQLFSGTATARETANIGKRVPTLKEWKTLIDVDDRLKKGAERFNLRNCYPGYRLTFDSTFHNLNFSTHFWASTVLDNEVLDDDAWLWYCSLWHYNDGLVVCYPNPHETGFSVRCVKS